MFVYEADGRWRMPLHNKMMVLFHAVLMVAVIYAIFAFYRKYIITQ